MDDRIKSFSDKLKAGLAGFPETETQEAVQYYEEYIYDALDEGETAESILSRLDPPEKIAAMILAETSIRKAQSSPGLKNYSKVLKYSRTLITRPFSILLFSIFVFATYGMALLLFLSSVVSAATAFASLTWLVYEAVRIPSAYTGEIAGTISFGIFCAALCIMLAIAFFKLCRLFVRLSAGLVGRILNKPGNQLHREDKNTVTGMSVEAGNSTTTPEEQPRRKAGSSGLALKACLIAAVAGLVLSLITGLPIKLFMIFNSMEPASVTTQEWEYNITEAKDISITTVQSHIRLEKGVSDKITLSYEKPDWLEPEISCTNGQLSFTEKSAGRLPLFGFVSMHENRTDLILTLPEGFEPGSLKMESRGGFIHIDTANFNVTAKTYTGNIYIGSDIVDTTGIKAETSTGVIRAEGNVTGTRTANGVTYETASREGNIIDIESSRGSIYIN